LTPLPPAPVPEYTTYRTRVSKWSIIRIARKTYTVPARLKGLEVEVRQYADRLEVYYKDKLMEEMERIHGVGEARIDYRTLFIPWCESPGPSPGIGLGRIFFPHRPSDWPMSPYAAFVGSVPT